MNRHDFLTATSALATGALIANPEGARPSTIPPALQFHSDFHVNLHHTLYYQASVLMIAYRAGADALTVPQSRVYQEMMHYVPPSRFSQWYKALGIYHDEYGWRSLGFDDELNAFDNALADGAMPSRLKTVFESVSSIYAETLWPIHDAHNRQRINEWQSEAARFGSLLPKLSMLYQRPWLTVPYRVDVVANTDRLGAYNLSGTRDQYWHIVTSSFDPENDGLNGFELVVHEASHSIVEPDTGPIGGGIAKACASLDRPEPDNLWHAAIMYIPGVVLKRLASQSGWKDYTLAFVANGVLTKAYRRYYAAFQRHLQLYIDGRIPLGEALQATVAEVVLD